VSSTRAWISSQSSIPGLAGTRLKLMIMLNNMDSSLVSFSRLCLVSLYGLQEFGSGTVSFCVSSPVLQMPFWAENGHGVDHGTAAGASRSDSIHVQAASLQQWAAQCSVSFKHSG
jgi:hypothetical protein